MGEPAALKPEDIKPSFSGSGPGAGLPRSSSFPGGDRKGPGKGIRKSVFWGIVFLSVLILIILTYLIFGFKSFDEKKLLIKISCPTEITGGQQVKYKVTVENQNRIALEDATLAFYFPKGSFDFQGALPVSREKAFQSVFIGTIRPGQKIEKDFVARIMGKEEEKKFANVSLTFQPKGISKQLQKTVSLALTIKQVPVTITIDAPTEIVSGSDIFYRIHYVNTSSISFDNLRLKVDFPAGFKLISSQPEPSQEDNIWAIGSLASMQEGQIQLRGIIKGQKDEQKTLEVFLQGKQGGEFVNYTKEIASTNIVGSPLYLAAKINGSEDYIARAGDTLNYRVTFRNDFDVPLEEVFVKAHLYGNMFDFSQLNTSGSFDITTNTITWTAKEVPGLHRLKPSQEGHINFSVGLKNNFPIMSFNDKNFSVGVSFEISTKKIPSLLGLSKVYRKIELLTKISTRLVLSAKSYHQENSSSIVNYGPVPPRVGQETTYTIHWSIVNYSNDLENAKVSARLPAGVQWKGNYTANYKREGIYYNENTRTVSWDIGKIPATTGVLHGLPSYEAVFQVSVLPAPSDVGRVLILTEKAIIQGKDAFTGEEITASGSETTSACAYDPTVRGKGNVRN